jgi:hypothetical protein
MGIKPFVSNPFGSWVSNPLYQTLLVHGYQTFCIKPLVHGYQTFGSWVSNLLYQTFGSWVSNPFGSWVSNLLYENLWFMGIKPFWFMGIKKSLKKKEDIKMDDQKK